MSNSVKIFKAKIAKAAEAILATQETAIVDVALKGKTPTTTQRDKIPHPPKKIGCEVNTKGNPQTNGTTGRGKEGESPIYWKNISGRGSR